MVQWACAVVGPTAVGCSIDVNDPRKLAISCVSTCVADRLELAEETCAVEQRGNAVPLARQTAAAALVVVLEVTATAVMVVVALVAAGLVLLLLRLL